MKYMYDMYIQQPNEQTLMSDVLCTHINKLFNIINIKVEILTQSTMKL